MSFTFLRHYLFFLSFLFIFSFIPLISSISHVYAHSNQETECDARVHVAFVVLGIASSPESGLRADNPTNDHVWRIAELSTAVSSLLFYHAHCPLTLHFVVDNATKSVVTDMEDRFLQFPSARSQNVQWLMHSATSYTLSILYRMTPTWMTASVPGHEHCLAKLVMDQLLPNDLQHVLVLDFDILILYDICSLWAELHDELNQSPNAIMAAVPELAEKLPIERILSPSRSKASDVYPSTQSWMQFPMDFVRENTENTEYGKYGMSTISAGYNTGFLFLHLNKLRSVQWTSLWIETANAWYATESSLPHYKTFDVFASHLLFYNGDQGIINRLLAKHPHLMHALDNSYSLNLGIATGMARNTSYISCDYLHHHICLHDTIKTLHASSHFLSQNRRLEWLPLKRSLWLPFLDSNQYGYLGWHGERYRRASIVDDYPIANTWQEKMKLPNWLKQWQCSFHDTRITILVESMDHLHQLKDSISSLLYYRTAPLSIIIRSLFEIPSWIKTKQYPWYLTDLVSSHLPFHLGCEHSLPVNTPPSYSIVFDYVVSHYLYHPYYPYHPYKFVELYSNITITPTLVMKADTRAIGDVTVLWRMVQRRMKQKRGEQAMYGVIPSIHHDYSTSVEKQRVAHVTLYPQGYKEDALIKGFSSSFFYVEDTNQKKLKNWWQQSGDHHLDEFFFMGHSAQTMTNPDLRFNMVMHDHLGAVQQLSSNYYVGNDTKDICRAAAVDKLFLADDALLKRMVGTISYDTTTKDDDEKKEDIKKRQRKYIMRIILNNEICSKIDLMKERYEIRLNGPD